MEEGECHGGSRFTALVAVEKKAGDGRDITRHRSCVWGLGLDEGQEARQGEKRRGVDSGSMESLGGGIPM